MAKDPDRFRTRIVDLAWSRREIILGVLVLRTPFTPSEPLLFPTRGKQGDILVPSGKLD